MPWIDITEREQEGWPPTTRSPYEESSAGPVMMEMKPGNFFTLVDDENFPCYVLFRALESLGWSWDIGGGRHWCHMWKDCYYHGNGYGEKRWKAVVVFSLWGQGSFHNENEHGTWGIGFEDRDGTWTKAMPHLTEFMKWTHERATWGQK